MSALDSLLSGSREVAAPAPAIEQPAAHPSESPFTSVLERVGGDEKLARKMTATFLRDTPQRMDGIETALKRKNGQKLASLAHALKGSVSIFGATAAHDLTLKLQEQGRTNELGGLTEVYDQLKEEIAKLEANLRGYAEQKRSPRPGASPESKRRSLNPKR
jgi:protein-histidine pros-kinase